MGDDAACPGATCTDDAQERLDAIASLGRVTGDEDVPAHYRPCAGDRDAEFATLHERLSAELAGVSDLVVEVTGGQLEVSGRAEPEQATLAARGALTVLGEEAVALADRVAVRFSHRMPLEVTGRLDEGRVCEQPPGEAMVSCEDDNSIPFEE